MPRTLSVTLLAALVLASCTQQPGTSSKAGSPASANEPVTAAVESTPPASATTSTAAVWPSVRAVQEENSKPGDPGWASGVTEPASTRVEGFTGRASATPGQPVALYVHSLEGPVVVKAFRIGWYAGRADRLSSVRSDGRFGQGR